MVKIRTAKSKGSQFEYDCQYSLEKVFPYVTRTSERGFQMQYDLLIENNDKNIKFAVECKRLKGISWNQLLKFYNKLKKVTDVDKCYILFKSNFQPCLVFYYNNGLCIRPFEEVFMTPFLKHPSTRVKK